MSSFNISRKISFVLGLLTLGLLIAPQPAKAISIIPLSSQDADSDFDDHDFRSLIQQNVFTELFVAESRIGNNSINIAERELGINDENGTPVDAENLNWGNGKTWNFSLEYTGNKVTYQVFDTSQNFTLTSEEFSGNVNSMFIRTFANQRNNSNSSSISLSNLKLNNISIGNLSSSGSTISDVDYLAIKGISNSFTLTGQTQLSWTGIAPGRSQLAAQIKVGNYTPIPEPSTIGVVLTGMMAHAFAIYRRKFTN
ncbi:PEP-CTERM putative exosortase interaction domain-containing protein [Nostoc sp. PCC 7524]|uniref:choice-of-anchor W domain-containing protein n=1 Tax=Nostoc sp. (strain ATCC 29411 / PCC 7524) TaxID=28072 RepID=UPI00029F1DA4|nr:choice-of-anchor W domain-containing protein [Nostoc sp. PCC 7524]AFY48854.1 PEP-CTERM putative exosortase interaction domain-containing protein [Nostoc sp. PCC 7524]